MRANELDSALHVLVYPRLNLAVGTAAERYAAILEPEATSFEAMTLENLCDTIDATVSIPEASAFRRRYLAFDRVPSR